MSPLPVAGSLRSPWPWVAHGARGPVLWLGGPMTEDAVRCWEGVLDHLWETGPRSVVLDLGAVTLLTGTAVGALARAEDVAHRSGARVRLREVPEQSARLLHWARLDHLISSYRGDLGQVAAAEWSAVASG